MSYIKKYIYINNVTHKQYTESYAFSKLDLLTSQNNLLTT